MTQQLDPKQVRGLKEELDTLDSMAKIKTIGANLTLSDEGELSATGGGGGGGGTLYSTLGDHIDGAITQKASTDLLAHKDDFDTLSNTVSTNSGNITSLQTAVAGKEPTIAAGTTSQYWRGDKSWQTLDKTAVGLGNVDNTSDATKKSDFTGSIASSNTGFVTGGDAYTALAAKVEATQTVSTDPVEATVTIDDITTSAVTTAKIADGAVTTAKIASGAVTASNIDFTTMPHIIACGTANVGVVPHGNSNSATISIPTQTDTSYSVLLTIRGGGSYYSYIVCTSTQITTTSFSIECWNNGNYDSGSMSIDYLVVRSS